MRVTKYVHSCLLVESDDKALLIDLGDYSVDSGLLNVDKLPGLDGLLITHGHFDHCNISFIKRIRERFPEVPIIANQEVVDTLVPEGITATTKTMRDVAYEQATHQPLPWRTTAPDNWSITVFDQLTHPGDSLRITETSPVLALPMQAPWGSMREAFDMAIELQPETIIPIHDWHWHETARRRFYEKARSFFQEYDITFLAIEDGQSIEISGK